jgi:serine/threonine protein kinase
MPSDGSGNTLEQSPRIGVWELGASVYASSNWQGYVVTHVHTGKAARLMHLQPQGPLARQSESILTAAERASRLTHPHLIEGLDWGLQAERAYVVTAMQGRTLQALAENGRPLAVRYMAALAEVLVYLRAQGLVYQNVDPGATVIGGDARSALLSWPVYCVPAGPTPAGPEGHSQRIVVPLYTAPEVLSGESDRIESSVDMFGLGAATAAVTAPLARLVNQLVHAKPQQRPSAQEVKEELTRLGRQLGVPLSEEGCPA